MIIYEEHTVNVSDLDCYNIDDNFKEINNYAWSMFYLDPGNRPLTVIVYILKDKITRDNATLEVHYKNRFALKLCQRIKEQSNKAV